MSHRRVYVFENKPTARFLYIHSISAAGIDQRACYISLCAISGATFELSIHSVEITSELTLLESQLTLSENSGLRRLKSTNQHETLPNQSDGNPDPAPTTDQV